jgi:nitrate reductase delta subunit
MKLTLKVLSVLLTYPTAELQTAIPQLRAALEAEDRLPQKNRDRLDRLLEEIATRDLYDLQERYVLLFDRTRSLSLHLFEHVHGESRDRGQAMVDLMALYERHGLAMAGSELPDHLPLFLEFLSEIPEAETRDLIAETAHILEAIRQRLKKRKVPYSSVFSCVLALAVDIEQGASHSVPSPQVGEGQGGGDARTSEVGVPPAPGPSPQGGGGSGCAGGRATVSSAADAPLSEPDDDPDDLAALDAAWEEEEVTFGPGAAAQQCGKDGLISKLRAVLRPAPGAEPPQPRRPIVTYNGRTPS